MLDALIEGFACLDVPIPPDLPALAAEKVHEGRDQLAVR